MTRLPLVYACAGCSAAGRSAYDVGLELDRQGLAEMSCLAGVAAAKSHFVKQLANREVWVVDGCPIECAIGVFRQQSRPANVHIRLHELGVKKASGAPTGMSLVQLTHGALRQVEAQRKPATIADQPPRDAASEPPRQPAGLANVLPAGIVEG